MSQPNEMNNAFDQLLEISQTNKTSQSNISKSPALNDSNSKFYKQRGPFHYVDGRLEYYKTCEWCRIPKPLSLRRDDMISMDELALPPMCFDYMLTMNTTHMTTWLLLTHRLTLWKLVAGIAMRTSTVEIQQDVHLSSFAAWCAQRNDMLRQTPVIYSTMTAYDCDGVLSGST